MASLAKPSSRNIEKVKIELQRRRRRLHFILGVCNGKIKAPFTVDAVRKWMFEGGFRIDSFQDLFDMPMKFFFATEIAELEQEIGQIAKAVELLGKKTKLKKNNGSRRRSVSEDVSKSSKLSRAPDSVLHPSPILRPAKAYLRSPKLQALAENTTTGDTDDVFENNFFL